MNNIVINWHILEKCNYSCGYCYAKYESNMNSTKDIHRSLDDSYNLMFSVYNFFKVKYKCDVRINFAGGEPFLSNNIIRLLQTAKEIGFSVSFISNGSLINNSIADEICKTIDIAGFSIDSSTHYMDKMIGRCTPRGNGLNKDSLINIIEIFKKSGSSIKINTVVGNHNKNDDMSGIIIKTLPDKWKILQELPVMTASGISSLEFKSYISRHSNFKSIIYAEDNISMTNSYLMIDPLGRFYQNKEIGHGYNYSDPILSVGIEKAFEQIHFNFSKFKSRYALAS
jgi:radical S-adenosyl methionine domain-containing protein 2